MLLSEEGAAMASTSVDDQMLTYPPMSDVKSWRQVFACPTCGTVLYGPAWSEKPPTMDVCRIPCMGPRESVPLGAGAHVL